MTSTIIGESVIGYSHIIHEGVRQDNYSIIDGVTETSRKNHLYRQLPGDIKIVAVADGHGSSSSPHSKKGSKVATNTFCDLMAEYAIKYKNDLEDLFKLLSNEGETVRISKRIVKEWDERILFHHHKKDREILYSEDGAIDAEAIWKQYGTTLLGMLITPLFIFTLQLGDGDITCVDGKGVYPVIEGDKMLGVETHSISKMDSWKKVITKTVKIENVTEWPFMYVISTDGWLNSHATTGEFHKTCREYFKLIRDKGADVVKDNLNTWLSETSKLGCGDDITVVFAYFQ